MAAKLSRDATELAEAGHFRKAAQLFAKAAEQDPSNAKHQEARAQCLLELEDFEEALSAAQVATGLDAAWLPGHATLGRAQLNAGRLQDAVASLTAALRLAEADKMKDWQQELSQELDEALNLLQRHWAEHHDVLLPLKVGNLRIRQALDCRYCQLQGELGPGGALWAAGAVLAQCLGKAYESKRVLELGSGTGAAGLAAAAQGAQVLLTDRDSLLPLLRLNTELNQKMLFSSKGAAEVCGFDWLDPPEQVLRQTFDVVIGADLVYSFAAVEPFEAAAPVMIYAHFPRFPKLDDDMLAALTTKGLGARELPVSEVSAVGQIPLEMIQRVKLLEIRRSS
ncbi:unnamed protein product [Effrenium voratum]|uniref:Uncharacterized protein n=1 Tax=Effrenium voratum TaxID=2562239 RepID=A0AA36IFX4_9DINO|nr:unnamed protein product [Effrenium voratum]